MRATSAVLVGVALLCGATERAEDGPAVFARLKSGLSGSWKLAAPTSPRQEAFRISFKQGNQPRWRFVRDDPKTGVEFAFQDATNLASEKDSHLVRMRIRLDGDRLEDDVYVEDGKEDVTTLTLVR